MPMNEAARVRQSADTATCQDVFNELVRDPSVTVRATLALNPAAPGEVNAILASDRDERVRALLGRKLAALTPNLTDVAHSHLRQETMDTLTALVADEAERVRASIAEAVKHMADAPRDIILRLARDPVVMVCEPVIRFSPVLTSHDLVGLIVAAPSPATVVAAARRPKIDAAVSDAIVKAANSEAIEALLGNASAQIRESTLDALVSRAAGHRGWQETLVRRPGLPARAARALSEIVTNHLLEVLFARADLEPALAYELRDRLKQATAVAQPEGPAPLETTDPAMPANSVQTLCDPARVSNESILLAAQRGDVHLVKAMLAAKSGVDPAVVERAAALHSAKGLVSLTWKAGLSMQVALALQSVVARLQPYAIIQPQSGGGFPMTTQEMSWQLEFLCRTGR